MREYFLYKTFGKRLSVDRLTQKFVCFFDLKDLLFYEHHIYFEWLKTQQTLIFIYTNKPVLFLNIFIFEPLHCYSWTNFTAYFIFWGWICIRVRTKKKTPSYNVFRQISPTRLCYYNATNNFTWESKNQFLRKTALSSKCGSLLSWNYVLHTFC